MASHTEAGKRPTLYATGSINICRVDSCYPSQPHTLPSFLQSVHGVLLGQAMPRGAGSERVPPQESLSSKDLREIHHHTAYLQHKQYHISQPHWQPEAVLPLSFLHLLRLYCVSCGWGRPSLVPRPGSPHWYSGGMSQGDVQGPLQP